MKHRSKLPRISTSIFSTMGQLAHQHNALNLSQGFPDFESDPELINLVTEAMKKGHNQYAPMPGIYSLREQLALKIKKLYNANYNPATEITITAGATQAIFTAITAFVRPGDEVILFNPAYDCYQPAIELCGAIPVNIQLSAPKYAINWSEVQSKITPKTKMIVINTPHNPCGTIWSKHDLINLENCIRDTNIIVLSDEVYEHIVFDDQVHESVCKFSTLKSHSLLVASFGKTFHNTGWKVGYCAGPQSLMEEFRKVHQFNVFSVNHPIQIALTSYLKNEENYLSISNLYQQKRDYFLEAIENSRFTGIPSQGTYFQIVDYSAISQENDVDFCKRLIIEHKLAAIPLSVFNVDGLDQYQLRFCFAKKEETLYKAATIISTL
ncbi:methionine aminotransferase [Flavobacteriaceae bacterium F08102]|nr:methionine aminotransferase [Flavobacteriaceae bacterium F08102]